MKKLILVFVLLPFFGFSQVKKYVFIEDYNLVKNELLNTRKIIEAQQKNLTVAERYEKVLVKYAVFMDKENKRLHKADSTNMDRIMAYYILVEELQKRIKELEDRELKRRE